MLVEYKHQNDVDVAFLKTEEGKTVLRLVLNPLSVYENRTDDYQDENVPCLFTMDIKGVLCSIDILNMPDIHSKVQEAAAYLMHVRPYRSIFMTISSKDWYQKCLEMMRQIAQHNDSMIVMDNSETQILIQKWTRFPERFGYNPTWPYLIFATKSDYLPVYQTNWVNPNTEKK